MKLFEKKERESAKYKNNICYWIAAIGIVAGFLAVFTAAQMQKRDRIQYDVVVFGDSLMGQCRDETSVTAVLEERLNRPVYNAAFGGTCMAVQDMDLEYNYTMTLLNMVSLSKALATNDFGVQQTVRSRRAVADYFEEVIEELPDIDFSNVKTIVIAYGLNDYHAGIVLECDEDPYDENTFGGALRSVLCSLRDTYPDVQIVLVTPTYTWYRSNGLTCEEYDTGYAFLEDYVQKELEIASEFHIPAIDLYHDGYEHEVWEDWERYTEDGLHPNEEARRMIAGRLAAVIEAEYVEP